MMETFILYESFSVYYRGTVSSKVPFVVPSFTRVPGGHIDVNVSLTFGGHSLLVCLMQAMSSDSYLSLMGTR